MEHHHLTAACNGDIGTIRHVIEREGMHPDAVVGIGGVTALTVACSSCNFEVARYLVEEHNADVTRVDDGTKHSCLRVACAATNNLDTVRFLVEKLNIDVTAPRDIMPALCAVCKRGDLPVLQYLLEGSQASYGIRLNPRETETLFAAACVRLDRNWDIFRYLVAVFPIKDFAMGTILRTHQMPWDCKVLALEHYSRRTLGFPDDSAKSYTIHAFLRCTTALMVCPHLLHNLVDHVPASALTTLDHQGRFPLHVVVEFGTTTLRRIGSDAVLRLMVPNAITARDPVTGLYPFETLAIAGRRDGAAALVAAHERRGWMDVMFRLLRCDGQWARRAQSGAEKE